MSVQASVPGSAAEGGDTKERLLDAAERLFAERGFEGASLRAVTQAAGTSVSAANYHFGSKEALLRATLRRRVEPVNRLRLERLDALEAAAAGAPLSLESLLDAFLRPAFEVRAAQHEGAAYYRQIAARLYSDPPELVADLKRELFRPLFERFFAALQRTMPDSSPQALGLAFQFMVGTLIYVMSGHLEGALGVSDGDARPTDEEVLARMVAYAAAGLRGACAA
jgi:AcrR family transcriptional regulator